MGMGTGGGQSRRGRGREGDKVGGEGEEWWGEEGGKEREE